MGATNPTVLLIELLSVGADDGVAEVGDELKLRHTGVGSSLTRATLAVVPGLEGA